MFHKESNGHIIKTERASRLFIDERYSTVFAVRISVAFERRNEIS
jgi:hypothetical protein